MNTSLLGKTLRQLFVLAAAGLWFQTTAAVGAIPAGDAQAHARELLSPSIVSRQIPDLGSSANVDGGRAVPKLDAQLLARQLLSGAVSTGKKEPTVQAATSLLQSQRTRGAGRRVDLQEMVQRAITGRSS